MLMSNARVAYLLHVVLLDSSAAYRRFLVEIILTMVGFLPAKMVTCKESARSCEGRCECGYYLFIGTYDAHVEEGMMRLGQSTLRKLKMGLLHRAISEVMGPLYWC